MALIALQLRVPSTEREANGIVIKAGRLPSGGGMAALARLGKSERYVIRIVGLLEVRQMAADAGRKCSFVFATSMASDAIKRRVHSRERESRDLRVIKPHALPVIDRVALLARRRKSRGHVVWRSGLLKRFLMAGIALD